MKKSSSGNNPSTTQHIHANAVALNQEAGLCQAKIPPPPTFEEGIELIALQTDDADDDDDDRAGVIFEMENLSTRDSRLTARPKQENSKNPKSKNHMLSSLSVTRPSSRKRSKDAGAEGSIG